ncbi:4-amino-4-deoxy-L-arabinose-phosphoundecaprenol flippase subunit ArnE [Rahnella sp. C60]|jgi:undecaprenyl phosphate-alpha-L-ara4N flippase subunit ArnE|uniref:4-amino-4-deoxy-L-arabinose-phosphoundecaprenol flippase subunit ArnE n=1 Tax=Rahnella perminowiae TaxID=2816244 RepID=A0ABS6L618_9GAMM|nr:MULTISPECIES: 4-amino-4-deoxy-L-arabinose-phosphoundecaprenol flippase subunit ArnE [Rahnella]UJD89975.1 4-amino-4-deoxy-L-arabinose-phosphoundecaprenol flippase subunit ArnE [Rahnella aquatilis]MBU9809618.1 4-amino-4-deoxy-L-arabinose-phosphoundecaprenol flippase subunit ArnE [Rahnella perminowiae]MBU9818075.1 4-amino-4-deoxy-L-arabinose-phosphoundecaprenol flippase subunit ArnE [Rahnella perminowiae]MBU9825559.1 4-amino-4-deoxy-L-arabinose-phosphoundecaprenol flippase subunit ArnE [Rahnell
MTGFFLVLAVSVITCAGQLCQKQAAQVAGQGMAKVLRWLGLAILLLGIAMLLWLRVLQLLPLSLAYPMLSLNFVFITLCARGCFGEVVDARHWCGVGLIMCGIAVMSFSL